jgi:hypothetical protein
LQHSQNNIKIKKGTRIRPNPSHKIRTQSRPH